MLSRHGGVHADTGAGPRRAPPDARQVPLCHACRREDPDTGDVHSAVVPAPALRVHQQPGLRQPLNRADAFTGRRACAHLAVGRMAGLLLHGRGHAAAHHPVLGIPWPREPRGKGRGSSSAAGYKPSGGAAAPQVALGRRERADGRRSLLRLFPHLLPHLLHRQAEHLPGNSGLADERIPHRRHRGHAVVRTAIPVVGKAKALHLDPRPHSAGELPSAIAGDERAT